MIHLIIDTNIWLYLANGLDTTRNKHSDDHHFKLLQELKRLKDNNDICIIVNKVIFEEWKRNKVHCKLKIDKLNKKLLNHDQHFRELDKYVKSETKFIKEEYTEGLKEEIKANEIHIQKVEDFLFNDCVEVEITNELKIMIFDLSVHKKAPFHNKKNNIADACILFSATEYLKKQLWDENNSAIFISNNFDDFTDGKNIDDFHPEILERIRPIHIKYERILPKALKLSIEIIRELEEYHKHEKWLDSVSFRCKTPYCEGNEDFSPWGYLDSQIEVKYKSDEQIDPNQTELFPEIPRPIKGKKTVGFGSCVICETFHIQCPECGELTYVDDYDTDEFECTECFTKFEVIHDDSEIGMSLIVNDTTDLEKELDED